MNVPDLPGVLLTEPVNQRGYLRVEPVRGVAGDASRVKTKALRVRVFTPEGRLLVDLRATEVEVTRIEVVEPGAEHPETRPGSFWFYAPGGVEVGFLADSNAEWLRPAPGRHTFEIPRTGPNDPPPIE